MDSRRPALRVASSSRLLVVSLLISTLLFCWPGQPAVSAAALAGSPQGGAPAFGRAALAFEPNAGQADPTVRYLARSGG